MSAAGPISFNTAARIIRFAMDNAGLLQPGDDPSGEDFARYMPRLNDLVNSFQLRGIKLWTNAMQSITLTAGTGTYTLGPDGSIISTKPLRVLAGYYVDVNNLWRPLDALSWDTYSRLSNPLQAGAVTSYFVDKQQNDLAVTLWLMPDATAATGTVSLLIQKQVTNLISTNDAINFPQEWFMALHWGLADEICTGQPDAIVQRCATKATQYRELLEDWDVEDASVYFQADSARSTNSSSFR